MERGRLVNLGLHGAEDRVDQAGVDGVGYGRRIVAVD
jgi:hypothetical protein